MKINLAEMYVDDEMRDAVLGVLESRRYIKGPNAKALENEFADFCAAEHAVTVSSGTAALFLALKALGIGPGDEVIVPAHTFIATASMPLHLGATPVFVDVVPETYTMDIDDVRAKLTGKTKALIPVHLYGHPCEMAPLLELAATHGLKVIEDACQSHGALYKGTKVGSIGDIACFSFFPSKNMTVAGDGGIVTTNDEELAGLLAMLRDHGRKDKYVHEILGFNFRLSELHAALGRVQLRHLPEWVERRRAVAGWYNEHLADSDITLPCEMQWARHVYHLYVIRHAQRDALRAHLSRAGIATGIHYPQPLHRQPCIARLIEPQSLRYTDELVNEILSLPLHPQMSEGDVELVAQKLNEFIGGASR